MSELDFGPHEQDYFVYCHMQTAASGLQLEDNVLNPRVSRVFAAQDQINRCRAKGIAEGSIVVGAALANIDAMNQLAAHLDATSPEGF
ncbi:MAG TPA: hypothetical protein VFC50_02400 [Candidatus Dormibacteraeota bacterium]|nr:hypothetical protein [Candidatus Dormibacteraeota bacterium]